MNSPLNSVLHNVITLLRERLLVPEPLLNAQYWNEPLTGYVFGLSPVDMAYLFFEIEKKFSLRVEFSKLDSYRFCSIKQIVDAIEETYLQTSLNYSK